MYLVVPRAEKGAETESLTLLENPKSPILTRHVGRWRTTKTFCYLRSIRELHGTRDMLFYLRLYISMKNVQTMHLLESGGKLLRYRPDVILVSDVIFISG